MRFGSFHSLFRIQHCVVFDKGFLRRVPLSVEENTDLIYFTHKPGKEPKRKKKTQTERKCFHHISFTKVEN